MSKVTSTSAVQRILPGQEMLHMAQVPAEGPLPQLVQRSVSLHASEQQ